MPQDDTPFGLVVRFTVQPGSEADFDHLVAVTAASIRVHEPGTLVYACHAVDDSPRQRIFYELYANKAAFEAHEQMPHIRRFLTQRKALLESTQVDFLTLSDGKTPAHKGENGNA